VRKIDEAWENGTISSGDTLTVQYVDESRVPFRSHLYKNLIVGLQTEDTVYYELDTAKKVAAEERIAIIAGFFGILLFWITITLLTLYTDDIVGIRRLTKSERKRMMEKGKIEKSKREDCLHACFFYFIYLRYRTASTA
jgi:hypothetical protein